MDVKAAAIVIPAHNEELTVREVISDFHRVLPDAAIYVIDNNSTDSTRSAAEETLKLLGCSGRVIQEQRQGKANAIRGAFQEIDADIYVMVDSDSTYSAEDLPKLLAPVERGEADMTVGDRQSGGSYASANTRRFHLFGNRLVRSLINILFRSDLRDIMSGYRVMNSFFVKNFPILSEGFELETEMTLHALDNRFAVIELPVSYSERPEGSRSKLNTYRDGAKVVRTIFRIFKSYRPFAFFTGLALLFFALGTAIGTPVIIEYLKYSYVYKVPSAILASGCMIFGLILFSSGVVLDMIVRMHRFDYELQLLSSRQQKPLTSSPRIPT